MGNRISLLIDYAGVRAARLLIALAACACGAAPVAAPAAGSAPVAVLAPLPLPSVGLTTLGGDRAEVAGLARGRVALVSLWATWCEACDKEMDALNRLDARAGADAVVIGVAVGEERGTVADFVRRRGLHYAQLVDPDFAFADAVGQRRLPATLVVDRRGRIVFRGEALDGASLDALRRALAAVE